MKKLIYCATALAMMFFVGSCQQELLETPAGDATVTYTVELPGAATKAEIGDGSNVNQLIYEVWKTGVDGDITKASTRLYQASILIENGAPRKWIVPLNLVQDQYYKVLFWAQVQEKNEAGVDVVYYNTESLQAVSFNENHTLSNQEKYAAFYGQSEVISTFQSPKPKTVTLTRPFAQLNIGTVNSVKAEEYTIAMTQSQVSVKVPTSFNVFSKTVGDVADEPVTFTFATLPAEKYLKVENNSYEYVAMNYVFAPKGQQLVSDVTYTIKATVTPAADPSSPTAVEIVNTIPSVPLKENFRTNIIGNLLTNSVVYDVVIDAKFDDPAFVETVEPLVVVETAEELQAVVNTATESVTIKLGADIESNDGIIITDKNITIDLNQKTFTVTEGASTSNRNFKINGSSVVTIKNGTMVAEGDIKSGAYGTVRTEDSAKVTLNDVKAYSYRGYGLNVKACTGTKITIENSEIFSQYSGGVEAAGGEIELNNVKIVQNGVDTQGAWCSVAIGVNGGGKVTINSGEYSAAAIATDSNAAQGTWVAYVMSSGGTLNINGGTFNGTIAETNAASNACGLICADAKAIVNIYEGTFNSNGAILDMRNNTGATPNPVATLYGGNFSADPLISGLYSSNLISVAEGMEVKKGADGRWTLVKVQPNNEIWYTSDEMKLEPTTPTAFNANIVSNVWDRTTGKGVITFDAPLTAIGNEAFKRITNTTPSNWITSISLPKSLETIGNYAFYQCVSLTSITIPDRVTSIGEYAFCSCRAATTVTIGNSVTSIASGAFYDCWELNDFICNPTTPPTLADKYVFSASYKPAKVIVPAGSVDGYNAAKFWNDLNIVAE